MKVWSGNPWHKSHVYFTLFPRLFWPENRRLCRIKHPDNRWRSFVRSVQIALWLAWRSPFSPRRAFRPVKFRKLIQCFVFWGLKISPCVNKRGQSCSGLVANRDTLRATSARNSRNTQVSRFLLFWLIFAGRFFKSLTYRVGIWP